MNIYLSDDLDSKSISLYDPKKSSFFNLDAKVHETESVLF